MRVSKDFRHFVIRRKSFNYREHFACYSKPLISNYVLQILLHLRGLPVSAIKRVAKGRWRNINTYLLIEWGLLVSLRTKENISLRFILLSCPKHVQACLRKQQQQKEAFDLSYEMSCKVQLQLINCPRAHRPGVLFWTWRPFLNGYS